MNLVFTARGWEDYSHWAESDRAMLKRINRLIQSATRTPFSGLGKPEPLVSEYAGLWSRRITDVHRLVYEVGEGTIAIHQARYHY
ncbi:MAG: Txe/YoeB family addiction module toxin [Bifidobacteriaceae bacterium]|jgi:toxin YoeB|nr:Txe/YoeB family addiction module toxin [Bifidobacteriaceae bacterium]